MKARYHLSYIQRQVVDALKSDGKLFVNAPQGGRNSFCAAVAVSEMAYEMGGITVRDAATGDEYYVPAGTPWQEALPAEWPED